MSTHVENSVHTGGKTTYCEQYTSYANDGKMSRVKDDRPCEWCGGTIRKNQLAVIRSYKIPGDGYSHHSAVQHLTCYDKTAEHCYQHGPRFKIHVQQPIWVLS